MDVARGDVVYFQDGPNQVSLGIVLKITNQSIHIFWLKRGQTCHYRGLKDLLPEVKIMSTAMRY